MTTNKNIKRFIELTKQDFKTYLGIAISIVLFIQFFQPFEIESLDFNNTLIFIAGFGVIVLSFLIIVQIFFQNQILKNRNDLPGSLIIIPLYYFSQVATTSLAFIFYIRFVGQSEITFNIVVRVLFICISLPITIYLKNLINSYQLQLQKLQHQTGVMKDKIMHFSENYSTKYIELLSDNESDNLRLKVSEILFVKSADNYVEVGFSDGDSIKKKIIRNTLKNVEQQLVEFNNFIRTHRTAIVNIQYINKLHKDFNTYWLSLENTTETIPVSRQYLIAVREQI